MPQSFHVLRCFSCSTYQVHIVKKVNKWQCKICNEKQSVQKVYATGSGKDCRLCVQELNAKRILLDEQELLEEQEDARTENGSLDVLKHSPEMPFSQDFQESDIHDQSNKFSSKWNKFVDTTVKYEESVEKDSLSDFYIVPNSRKRYHEDIGSVSSSLIFKHNQEGIDNTARVPAKNNKLDSIEFKSEEVCASSYRFSPSETDSSILNSLSDNCTTLKVLQVDDDLSDGELDDLLQF